jgi:tetratricopeptide (TPR) repeat protein/dsDNA-binding SOS-regulon protein
MKLHIQNRRIKEPTFTLHGEGGVGKTQTVLKYIAEQQEHHKHILWANADSRDKLSSDFDHLAAKLIPARKISLSPEANREAVKLWLQNNDDWLLVFDNADKPDVLKEFWPFRAGRGCIIVTSRDSSVSNLAVPTDGVQVAEVGCLRDDDGAELLMSRLPEQMRDLEASRKISHRLGGLPLAIAHIASYINNDLVTTLSEFLDDYDKIEESVVEEHGAGYATLGYQRSLSTAWKMSLDALSSPARKFIDAVALLDPTEIPVNLLLPTMTLADRRTISELIKSSLVHKNTAPLNRDGGSLIIHRLVQDACRRPWSPKRWQVVFDQAVSHVSDVFPKQINGASMIPFYPDCKKYDSHVLSLGQHFESSLATPHPLKGSLQFAEMLAHCGWFHYERMQFQTATFVLRMAADILSDAEGRERELVLALVLNNLHLIDVQYSRLDAGEKLIRRAVELREKWLRSSDFAIQELGNSYSNYANILRKRSLVTETEQLFLKALEIRENGAGATDELLHHTLYNYGSWMLEMGRVDEARAFLSRALNLPNQETTSIYGYTVYCVARLEYMTGNITESLEIHKRCLKWRIETEGWEHLLTGVSLHKVGSMQLDLGNEAEGIANLTKALHAFRQSKGDKGLLPRTLLKLGRTIRSRAIRTNSYEGMIEGGTMVDEGSELAKSYRGPNVSLESEDDLNNLVKSTYR